MKVSHAQQYVPGEVLVKTKPNLFQSTSDLAKDYGAEVLDRFESNGLFQTQGEEILHLKLPQGTSTEQAMEKMSQDPRVAETAPNTIYHLAGEPLKPSDLSPSLWGMNNTGQDGGTPDADIDAPEAWATCIGTRENGPIIAVLDTGQDYDHPDLKNNLWTNPGETADGNDSDGNGVIDDLHGYNAVLDNGDARAGHGHGTHCAGTIGAEGNNDQGVVGVNWRAQIMPIKIFPDDGDATTAATIIRAVRYADKMGARVTSNSWTGAGYNPIVRDVFAHSPALHIFAAGNDARDNDFTPDYPANFGLDNAIVVAASDRNDELGSFSSYGKETVDLAAPGVAILSTVPGGGYEAWNGTSMATPHVAGAAGLVATAYPDISNQQLKDRLLYSTEPKVAFKGKTRTEGRLNVARAIANDNLPPAAPTDFRARALPDKMRMAWTSTGDDGWCGQASAYEVKLSPNSLASEEAFQAAETVAWSRAAETGKTEAPMFDLMPSGTAQTVHVGMKIIDKVGNRSALSEATVNVPAARVAFEDHATEAAWSAEGGWNRTETAERGQAWRVDGPGSLVSQAFRLDDFGDSCLYLEAKYDLEPHYEFVKVEVSEVGSDRWRRVAEFNGDSHGWRVHKLPMHDFDQKEVQIRLTYEGDGPGESQGFELSRAAVTGYEIGTQKP